MPSPIYERRAREARRLIIEEGLDLTTAAERVGMGRQVLKKYLDAETPATKITVPQLCDVLETVKGMDQETAAQKLREFRFSYHRISEILGMSPTAVYNWRDRGDFNKIDEDYDKRRE